MAETLISPGVLARENDQSQILSQPIQAGAAIIGPTVKGKVNIPTLVTSYSEYAAKFGTTFESGSDTYSFLTSISAYNYFQNGGTTLLVTRVQSGSFSPATSSYVTSGTGSNPAAFVLETLTDGEIMNSDSTESSKGSLLSGSKDNLRWEIVAPNSSSGTFTVLIRRGDDNTKSKTIVESFNNVSLDPKAPNYISRIIGDKTHNLMGSGTDLYLQSTGSFSNASKYVRVKEVNLKTPDYLDNDGIAKSQYTSSIPVAQSGTFGDATGNIAPDGAKFYELISNTNIQGLVAGNYTDAINLLANKDEFRYNVITVPGLIYANAAHKTPLNTLISNIEGRGDAIVIIDTENYGSTPTAATSTASEIDSSYTSTYWPWLQITDPDAGQLQWVPASTLLPGVYAYTDKVSESWFAPAGVQRGGMSMVKDTERKLTNTVRDTLYVGKVNPIATFPGRGVVVYGQKTLQSKASALDRVNVRRLLIELKSYLSQVAENLVFEQNTIATRNQFLSQANPYMESVQQRQGLYAFKVIMDESNNTNDVIDRNELVGQVLLQPTKTSEFVYLDFTVTPTGVEF